MAFSAGKRKLEYESYFMELGVKNIIIFSDRLIDLPPDASYMEEVVAVFATPPNSYSAVSDPIDLVCSRGGDLTMLEVLTESDETQETQERVRGILEEQRRTLRFAMSRPQIQFVLYETHSELDAENSDMVNKTLRDINRLAKIQHATLQGKLPPTEMSMEEPIYVDIRETKSAQITEGGEDTTVQKQTSIDSVSSKLGMDTKERFLESLQVPDTDIFNMPELPSLCPNDNSCINFKKEGCYLALIQRKEIIRLDDKYMIQMAENRGLFGSTTTQGTVKSKTSKSMKKKQEKDAKRPKPRKKLRDAEIDRIAAPTHTFLSHTKHDVPMCRRCQLEQENLKSSRSQYKKWWTDTARHILHLKKFLVRQKIMPQQKLRPLTQTNIVNSFIACNSSNRIDEIAAKCNDNSRFPIFPKLRLTREIRSVKIPVPVSVTTVEFPESCVFCAK